MNVCEFRNSGEGKTLPEKPSLDFSNAHKFALKNLSLRRRDSVVEYKKNPTIAYLDN